MNNHVHYWQLMMFLLLRLFQARNSGGRIRFLTWIFRISWLWNQTVCSPLAVGAFRGSRFSNENGWVFWGHVSRLIVPRKASAVSFSWRKEWPLHAPTTNIRHKPQLCGPLLYRHSIYFTPVSKFLEACLFVLKLTVFATTNWQFLYWRRS